MQTLHAVREQMPVVLHGVSLGVGSADAPDPAYLRRLRALADRIEPAWISDHLCWTHHGGHHSHALLPLPLTRACLDTVVAHVDQVQEALGRQILLENTSSYITFQADEMREWEFLTALCERTDCRLLLDLNNIVVSCSNHGWDPAAYLDGVPAQRVGQFHLANHSDREHYKFDSHCGAVPDAVWALYREALARFGPVSSLVEWDEQTPEWALLRAEQRKAAAIAESVLGPQPLDPPTGPPRPASPPTATSSSADTSNTLAHTQNLFWQRLFWRAITHPTGVSDMLAAADAQTRSSFDATFAQTPQFSRLERMGVYADDYFWRLAGVLETHFPTVAWYLGQVRFHNLATDYVLTHPSIDPDLRAYSARFPAFVARHEDGQADPEITHLAPLELARVDALTAPDRPPLEALALASVALGDWPRLRFEADPSATLHRVDRPFSATYALRREGVSWGEAQRRHPRRPTTVLVWRRGLNTRHRDLDAPEAAALAVLLAGGTFLDMCSAATALGSVSLERDPTPDSGERDPPTSDTDPRAVAAWLRRWFDDALICAVDLADPIQTPSPEPGEPP